MNFVRRLSFMRAAYIHARVNTQAKALTVFQQWKRCRSLALGLLLGFCILSNTAHASAAGCASVTNFLASDACNGIDPYDYKITLSCYTTPATSNPAVTDLWQVVTYIPDGSKSVNYIGEYLCSGAPAKNVGKGALGTPMVGDPINASTGNKYLQEDDYLGSPWLTFRRYYNSQPVNDATLGWLWRHSFDRSLTILGSPVATIMMARPDGTQEVFTKTNGVWLGDTALVDTLTETDNAQGVATSYTVWDGALRHVENYSVTGLLQTETDETGTGITLTYSTASTPSNVAPKAGLLLTVTDPKGRQLNFVYNSSGNLSQVMPPDQGTLTYAYNTNGNLTSVQYPDGTTRQYVYNESSLTGSTNLPNAMTGLIDESGVRYANTAYNGTGFATSTSFAGGVETTQITYNSNGTSTVQYPLGHSATLGIVAVNGFNRTSAIDQPCGPDCDQPAQTLTYDANGYPASSTDFNTNLTTTQYNAYGLLDQQIDAQGQPAQRTTNTTWNTTLRVPLTRTVSDANNNLLSSTAWVYNTTGQTLARCDIDPGVSAAASYTCSTTGTVPTGVRRSTYTYCTAVGSNCPLVGLLLTSTGPRTDLTQTTSYSYYTTSSATSCDTPGAACYQAGDLYQVTDPLGHVTTITSYDADGRITRITDANGTTTDSTYTPRGWLATRSVGGSTTTFTYTPYGAVQTVTDPYGITTTYGYDAAHRLTSITDALGNVVQYTLDAAGDKTAEQTVNAMGTVTHSLSRGFNALGQLTGVTDGLNQPVFNASASGAYDANGNLLSSTDALGTPRQRGYDALNRLIQTIDNYNGTDPATQNTTTAVTYDSLDRTTQVTDPSSLNTTYRYDGLSNATGQTSPDTGTTNRTFDAAGNVLTRTDAKGITATLTYDADNRPLSVSYPDSTQSITYTYDEANSTTNCTRSYPTGRLTRIVENAVTTVYCYDPRGNVIQKQQITITGTDTTGYSYTAANRLNGLVYPSGSTTTYSFDADGRIQSIALTPINGSASTAVSNVTYLPFGPISSYTLGNGQTITRTYDANYRFTDITSPALNLHVARDAMGNITALGNAAGANPATETYGYDPLYRLQNVNEASGTALESYTYNKTGDRLSKTASITEPGTGTYGYTTNTHQLLSIGSTVRANDANGNTASSTNGGSVLGFGYNDRNRLAIVQSNSTTVGTYTYNALGQRIGKVATSPTAITERYDYDQQSQLLSEYGSTNRDYIWLGSLLVATVDNSTTPTISYVHVDGLGTPRTVTNSAGTVIWQWAYQGNPLGQQPPTSSTGYVLNLGFPGQYYDAESGLYYNMHRDFDAASGRYVESDLMGLYSGQISTYAYVGGDPIDRIDPYGLWQLTATVSLEEIPIGGTLTFGYNHGQFNLGGWLGAALGDSFSINPNNVPCHEVGTFRSTLASGKIGSEGGILSTDFSTQSGPGVNSTEFTTGVPFFKPLEYGVSIENGQVSSVPVVNIVGGGSVFLGSGAQTYY